LQNRRGCVIWVLDCVLAWSIGECWKVCWPGLKGLCEVSVGSSTCLIDSCCLCGVEGVFAGPKGAA
jgi:hypothetical protein